MIVLPAASKASDLFIRSRLDREAQKMIWIRSLIQVSSIQLVTKIGPAGGNSQEARGRRLRSVTTFFIASRASPTDRARIANFLL